MSALGLQEDGETTNDFVATTGNLHNSDKENLEPPKFVFGENYILDEDDEEIVQSSSSIILNISSDTGNHSSEEELEVGLILPKYCTTKLIQKVLRQEVILLKVQKLNC